LVCNARADIPGTSLVVNISLERDLPSLWMDPNFSGISTTYTRSFLKVSLQKIPTDKIVPIPSQNSIQRTVWKIRGLLGL
jgi:hypothetical protein